MFISEMAMRERRPGHVIRRGSKDLATSSWSGGGYRSNFTNEESLLLFLRTNDIRYLVLDSSLPPEAQRDYHRLLRRTAEQNPARFTLEDRFPIERAGVWDTNGIRLYRLTPDAVGGKSPAMK